MDIGRPEREREIEVVPLEEPLPREAPLPQEAPDVEPAEKPIPA